MKRLKFLVLASLVAFAACDEDDTVDPATQVGSVNVTVTAGGTPLQGVTVSLGAAGTTPQTTSAAGTASFTSVPVGTYTVTLTGITSDVVCSSTTQPVTVAAGSTTAVTFACNLVRTSSISGTVAFSNGDPRPNATVTVTRTLPAPADAAVNLTTNSQGQYSLTGLRSGTYTVSLGVTTGCTTAANTQTVAVAAGEARVVNFTCTVAPPPPPSTPATVAIQSITQTNALGQQVPIPSNQVQGLVNVNMAIDEGDQKVSRVRLLLGTQTVYDQTFVTAAPELALATLNITAPVETREFNQTTGVPRFLNTAPGQTVPLVAEIFTVAGGTTTPATAANFAVVLANQDATYATVTFERNALSTNTTLGGPAQAGKRWFGGEMTVLALPVMYSGLGVQSVTLQVEGFVPSTDLIEYYDDHFNTGDFDVGSITDDSAPYTFVLPDDDDLGDEGVDDVEDDDVDILISVLRSDGAAGPATGGDDLCSDNRVPNFTLFLVNGCASGQPADQIRLDNFAPVAGQLDRIGRWDARFASPSRPDATVTAFSGVTGWLSETFTFGAVRLEPGDDDSTEDNATQPGVSDLGVGLPTTNYAVFRAGTSTTAMNPVTTAASLTETFNDDVYYVNVTFQDVFGAAGEEGNQRTRFYDRTFDGTGTSTANITAITAAGSGARFGVDKGDPCYTTDNTTCDNGFLDNGGTLLNQDREVIGIAGTLTIGNGGVMDGTGFLTTKMDPQGPEAGSPSFFPTGPNITRIRRMAPAPLVNSVREGCLVGVLSNNNGTCNATGASGSASGIADAYDFFTPVDGGFFYTTTSATTGVVNQFNTDRGSPAVTLDFGARTLAQATGYIVVDRRVTDNAGNMNANITKTFVFDRTAPVVGGISSAALVTAGAQTAFSAGVADELDLDRADFFLRWPGLSLAIWQSTTAIGEFGPAAYALTGTATANVQYFHSMRVAGGAEFPTVSSLFRVFDFGRNAAEATGAVPTVNNPPAEPNDITVTSQYSSANILCWDTDANGCTNPTSATLTFQLTSVPNQVPFVRVDFLVGVDVNNDGAVDLDTQGNEMFVPIVSGSAVSVINNVATYTRAVTVPQLVAASRRTLIQAAPSALDNLHIRAVGYRNNGTAFTVAAGAAACTNAAGSNAACTIQLQRQ